MNLVLKATQFAALKHCDQRRKDGKTPYIIHPISVAMILAEIGSIEDPEILSAALLHDTLEDTDTSAHELEKIFGSRVRIIVEELTDNDMLTFSQRKQMQIDNAPYLSKDASLVRIADKISNVSDVIENPPPEWNQKRCNKYVDWAEAVMNNCQKVNQDLENHFFELLTEYRKL
jgi:guanosine-3',5'-bis(diphosphate) 3'-pyrophosphohydrolase